ncbi:hypothetical protein PR048_026070 [Dryococelus australis]|uniref:Uncharacterized protein n=1 Tax=Dryococelus australis TaxID=614101 RepID=A0ABQ9GKA9_9NEOP|nr:hypothetical protein PR048_026070 [Dryococelus australis]
MVGLLRGPEPHYKIILLLKAIIEEHPILQCITQHFLISGHSFLPNDSDFGDIESARKYQQQIYTATDYMNIIMTCRKKNPLAVKEMKRQHFVGTEKLETMIQNCKIIDILYIVFQMTEEKCIWVLWLRRELKVILMVLVES